jgi:tetratricopeptide (TPR) repeat protein
MFVKISPAKRRLRTRKRCGNCFVRWIERSTLDVNQGGFAAKFLASRAEKCLTGIGGALLVVGPVAAYANHFHNSFHFDDAHTIVNNASIRELRNIPLFFRDATTFSLLPSNQSYRPLVSTLLAVDYRLGGLQPFWFHLSIFVLFVALAVLLAFVVHRLLEIAGPSPANRWVALIAAAWYGVHPGNADAVNYIIASSEVISTLGVIVSFALYFAFPKLRRYHVYVLPAAIAILAKPTAAIFAVLFAFYRLLLPSETITRRSAGRRALAYFSGIAPSFLICGAMLLLLQHMTPRSWIAGAANARNYLITQPYVALLYLKTFFWPSGLSADYDLNPFATTDDPRFWAGFAFVIFFTLCAVMAAVFKKTRVIGFGLLWFLVALLTTSLLPLAEVMNDHRTFLPYVGLVIAMAGAVSLLVNRKVTYSLPAKIAAICTVVVFLCANAYATFQRNKVWKSEETLWHDVVLKSPGNGRGLMNYGNTLMAKGDYAGALDYFHRAQQLTPQYSVLLINLAIAENATKQSAAAEQHFKDALRLAPASPDSYTYYARYLLAHSRADEARAFLQSALELSPTDLTARELIAKADGQVINEPTTQTPEYYLDLSLQNYREERYAESIAASRAALKLRPNYAEAWNNIGAAYNQLGRYEEAAAACEQALRYKPDFELARNNLQYAREKLKASVK